MIRTRTSLGIRFLLIVLLAVALPLGLAGVWMVRDAGRAGEALLRSRMEETLDDLVQETGSRWVGVRARILDLAEDRRLQDALAARATGGDLAALLVAGHPALGETLHGAVVRESGGGRVARLSWGASRRAADDPGRALGEPPGGATGGDHGAGGPGLPAVLDVRETGTGELLGHLEVRVVADALLWGWGQWAARTGGVVGVLEEGTDRPLVSVPFDPALLGRDRFTLDGEDWITHRRALPVPPVVLVLASPLEPFALPFREAARRGILLILAVGIGGFAVATLLTARSTRPLADLADAAEAVARGDLGTRVSPEGPEEVARVARGFNTMAASLRRTLDTLAEREALAAVGEFAAALAHELRNPLTAMRLDLQRIDEVSGDEERRTALTERILSAARRLDRTVEGVLRLAVTGRAARGPVVLDETLERAARTALPSFEARGAELVMPPGPGTDVVVEGDAPALEQLLVNLLVNAAEAMEDGGRTTVQVREEGDGVEFVVRDTGPGFSGDVLERAREPLFTTKARGTGLGLAIADRIVRAHGGRLELANDPEGGARVTVWLPGAGEGAG